MSVRAAVCDCLSGPSSRTLPFSIDFQRGPEQRPCVLFRQAGGQSSHCEEVRPAAAVQADVLQPLWQVPAPGPAHCLLGQVQAGAPGALPSGLS